MTSEALELPMEGIISETMIIQEMRISCLSFARDYCKHGIYSPTEILAVAQDLFEWVVSNKKTSIK